MRRLVTMMFGRDRWAVFRVVGLASLASLEGCFCRLSSNRLRWRFLAALVVGFCSIPGLLFFPWWRLVCRSELSRSSMFWRRLRFRLSRASWLRGGGKMSVSELSVSPGISSPASRMALRWVVVVVVEFWSCGGLYLGVSSSESEFARKGKVGKIAKVIVSADKVLIPGINVVKKHEKPSQDSKGGIVNKDMPIHISNILAYDAKNKKASRVGFKIEDGKKVRILKSNGEKY